jgi:hypothetical protein
MALASQFLGLVRTISPDTGFVSAASLTPKHPWGVALTADLVLATVGRASAAPGVAELLTVANRADETTEPAIWVLDAGHR